MCVVRPLFFCLLSLQCKNFNKTKLHSKSMARTRVYGRKRTRPISLRTILDSLARTLLNLSRTRSILMGFRILCLCMCHFSTETATASAMREEKKRQTDTHTHIQREIPLFLNYVMQINDNTICKSINRKPS